MISDTSPIIFFAKIKRLDLLENLYGKIKITQEIKEELLCKDKPDTESVKEAIQQGKIIIESQSKTLNLSLGKGESSAISLAVELKEPLIIDDYPGFKAAQSLNIKTFRTTSVIFSAVKKKILTKKEALDIINKIIEEGYYISTKYYKEILDKLK